MLMKFFKNRINVLVLFALALACVLFFRIIDLQLINGSYYAQIAEQRLYNNGTLIAPRGEISDRYGRVLVTNKDAYSVIINDLFEDNFELNATLIRLINIAENDSYQYDDTLPVSYGFPYEFRFGQGQGVSSNEFEWKEYMEVPSDSSAEDIINILADKYEITSRDDKILLRKLVGIRYDMQRRNFSSGNPFTFAQDVSIRMVSKIKETPDKLIGVDVASTPIRTYPMENTAAQLLGQVGIIYAEEYAELKEKGYKMTDTLGKDGLEKYLESYLKGTDGMQNLGITVNGETIGLADDIAPIPGNKAVLTIDADVQKTAEASLAEAVALMKEAGATDIEGAAAVAIHVDTGEIIAMANYPTYNPATFRQNYSKLSNDKNKPMFNRCIGGAYPPGSTFKPLTAIAGLQEGLITGTELINCNGPYEAYAPSYTPACWIYNDAGGSHEYINVVKALEVSCNIYFYETGRRLGIDKLNQYGKAFGLGELSGIEISGEAKGILAGPEYRKTTDISDGIWYPGDTIQAAIGQSDNMFTPLQMANYIATIANGGTRYAPHLVKEIIKHDGSETLVSFEPKVLNTIEIAPENLKFVQEGMRSVVTEGSAKVNFADAKYEAAGKTGTAQTRRDKTPHSWFVSYAPFDEPKLAIAVIVEYGGVNSLGKYVSKVARNMYDAYFFSNNEEVPISNNTLIN